MQRAARRGPGRCEMFTGEMRAQRLVRIANKSSLREALVKGEFYVEYQPKVSLVTDRTVGVEALLRWMHPDRGLISPLDFIPLAEESGIIVQISGWVLEQVCRDAIRWRTALPGGHPLMVAVNVYPSPVRIGSRGDVRRHHRALGHRPRDRLPRSHREHGHAGRRTGDRDAP